ncbi:tetratricopeptide repeat protein [Lunatimonas lonarensis]|uniref:tetratricopeptide repeat protein n=1 Tax=Lunatimonas lonarensis TaxID=1232681 RepID=UPI0005638DC7|nr:tetratricopeptide repeat protein [Lunatimonas lonarensis]
MNKINVKQVKTVIKKAATFVQVSQGFLTGLVIFLAAMVLINGMWLVSAFYKQPDLFSQFFEIDDVFVPGYTPQFERAITEYQAGNYEQAIRLGRSILEQYPTSDTLKYFLGSSHLAQRDIKASLYYLRDVAADDSSPLQSNASYGLGLAYLLEGNASLAIYNLERSSHPRSSELLRILSAE